MVATGHREVDRDVEPWARTGAAVRIPGYLDVADSAEESLAVMLRRMATAHTDEPDIDGVCRRLADQCDRHRAALRPLLRRYGTGEPVDLAVPAGGGPAACPGGGSVALLRDLQELWMLASFVHLAWTVVEQAANGLRDHDLVTVVRTCDRDIEVQLQWLTTRIKETAPQALIVGR